ncbi:hypothetical protein EI94DRAFT_1057454 [Lactarius quietus]|nr:hypothetical protein EI94DRAFT_1057454 [Lactarius quietus]
MSRRNTHTLLLGQGQPTGPPVSAENYTSFPLEAAPLSHVSTNRPAIAGVTPQLSNRSSSAALGMALQHPSAAIGALTDSPLYLDERYGQSSAPEVARIPSPIRLDSESNFSHACQASQCQKRYIHEPTIPTTTSYNDHPAPIFLGTHPLSISRPSGLQKHIPTSSHYTNKCGELFFEGGQDLSEGSCRPIHAVQTFPPAESPNALGVAQGYSFHQIHQRRLDSPSAFRSAVANDPIIDLVSNLCEGWRSPTKWMCATSNAAQLPDVDRSALASNSHTAVTLYDSLSHEAPSPMPQLHSTPNHLPLSSPSPEGLHNPLAQDSSHQGQNTASAELSPAIRVSSEASPIPPVLLQSESIKVEVVKKQNRCPLCGALFTQSQVLNRHMKDKHEDKGSCSHCPSFRWSRGRPHLYAKHLRVKHSRITLSEDPPGGIRKAVILRTRKTCQCKVLNKKTQIMSRGLVPNQ